MFFTSDTAYSESWTITQKVILGSSTSLQQGSISPNTVSVQALNGVSLMGGTVTSATQTVTATGQTVTLESNGGSNNVQAGNYIKAGTITSASQSFSSGIVNLKILDTKGTPSSNIQALNFAHAADGEEIIGELTQSVTVGSMNFNVAGGDHNIQAGNFAQANKVTTSVTQSFNATGNITYTGNGTSNLQAGNVFIKSSAAMSGTVTQNFSAANITADFAGTFGSGSIKAANYFAVRPQ